MGRPPLNNIRTHVNLDPEALARIDAVVGEKGRSKFIRDAVNQVLDRLAPVPARSGPPYFEFTTGEARLSASGTVAVLAAVKARRQSLDKIATDMGFKNDPSAFLAALLGHAVISSKAHRVIVDLLPDDHQPGQFPTR